MLRQILWYFLCCDQNSGTVTAAKRPVSLQNETRHHQKDGYHMRFQKRSIAAVAVLAAGALVASMSTSASAEITMKSLLSKEMQQQQIFAGTYMTGGATSTIYGNIIAGTYLTTGVNTTVDGSTSSGTDTTLGANSTVSGSVQSAGDSTLGSNSVVAGNVNSGVATTFIDGATSASKSNNFYSAAAEIESGRDEITDVQQFLLRFEGNVTLPEAAIATDTTFKQGIYTITGYMSVAADITITLDANYTDSEFIFNISKYLSFGENVQVRVINATENVVVIWNAGGGYVSFGANADVVGNVLAQEYVTIGAQATILGIGADCGGAMYSATSYITIGAGAIVGTTDDNGVCKIPSTEWIKN
jgi:predicted acyltransferase (DUF342 family)